MKPFTTEEIIKIIYHDSPEERDKLLVEYAASEEDQKSDTTQIISEEFLTLYDDLAMYKYDQFMNEITAGTRQITGDMMQQAYRAVHEDLAQVLTGKHQDTQEIKALQQKLQTLAG